MAKPDAAARSGSSTPKIAEDLLFKAKPTTRLLQQFSHGIISTTREASKRDSAKKDQIRSMKEHQKWQTRYDAFAPLADLRRRNLASNEKKIAKSEGRLNDIKQDHRAVTGQLATTLGSGGIDVEKTTASHAQPQSKKFEAVESKQFRLEQRLQSLDEEQDRLVRTVTRVEQSTAPMSTIRAMEQSAADLTVKADKVERVAKHHANFEARLDNLERTMEALQLSINQTQGNVTANSTEIQTLQSSYKDQLSTTSDLKKIVDQERETLRILREVVSGSEESHERSLFDMITDAQKDDFKLREAISGLNQTMNEFEDGIKELKAQAISSDKTKANLEVRLNSLEHERSAGDIQEDLTSMKEQLSILSEKVKKVVGEQNVKDDMIATEVERLDNELMKQAYDVKILSEKLDTATKDLNRPPSNPPEVSNTSSHLTNGILNQDSGDKPSAVHELELKQESIKQEFVGLQSSFEQFKNVTSDTTSTHDVCINSLQQRFDNLTTDHMVRAMINQLQLLYPNHPANLNEQVIQLTMNHRRFYETVSQISHQLGELEKKVKANQDHIVPLVNQGSQRIEAVFQNRFDAQTVERTQLRESLMSDINHRLKILNEDSQESNSVIKQDLEDHLNRIQSLQKSLQASRTDHTTSINALTKDIQDLHTSLKTPHPPPPPEIEKLEKELAEMRDSTLRELTLHFDAIQLLNAQCGLSNAALEGADDDRTTIPAPPSPSTRTTRRGRSPSMSLGQPSSPPSQRSTAAAGPGAQLVTASQGTDGAGSDSDPPVSNTSNRKRRGRRSRKEEPARARKVSKMGS